MNQKIYVFFLVAALALTGCQNIGAELSGSQQNHADSFQLIGQSATAWVYHISPFAEASSTEFEGFPILNGPVELYQPEFNSLVTILGDSTNFPTTDELKMCVFTPSIGIDFLNKNQESIQKVILSLDCDRFRFLNGQQKDRLIDFDIHKKEITAIFYPIFKEEPYFQAYKN